MAYDVDLCFTVHKLVVEIHKMETFILIKKNIK